MKRRTVGFDSRQLEYFRALVRAGSFTRGAAELGISQPVLSEQTRALERSLAVPSFERLKRRVERALIEDAATLPDCFESVRDGTRGPLRVGAIPTILPYFRAPQLKVFAERFGDVDLHVREANTAELVAHVLEGTLDLAVIRLPAVGAGLVMKELFHEPSYLAVSDAHPLPEH